MVALAVAGRRETGGRPTSSCGHDGAVVHVRHARERFTSAATGRRSCSSSSAPTRSPRSQRGTTTRRFSTRHTSPSSRGPAFRSSELPQRLPRLASRMVRPPLDPLSQIEPLIIFDRRADRRRVIHCDPCSGVAAGESIAGLVPPGVQQHIEQHGLYTSMTPGRRASDHAPDVRGRQVAWPKLTNDRRRLAFRHRSNARLPPPKTRRRSTSWCSICGRRRGSPTSS